MYECDINELLNFTGFGLWNVKFLLIWLYIDFISLQTLGFISHSQRTLNCLETIVLNNSTNVSESMVTVNKCSDLTIPILYSSGFLMIVFTLFFSVITDRIGRKQTLLLLTVAEIFVIWSLQRIDSIFCIFLTQNILVVFITLKGFALAIMLFEMTTKSNRGKVYYTMCFLKIVSIPVLGNIQLLKFKIINIYATFIILVLTSELFLMFMFLDKSPRWLLQKKRFKETAELIEKIFIENKAKMQPAVKEIIKELSTLKMDEESKENKRCTFIYNLWELFSSKQSAIILSALALNILTPIILNANIRKKERSEENIFGHIINVSVVLGVIGSQGFVSYRFGRKPALISSVICTILLRILINIHEKVIGINYMNYIGILSTTFQKSVSMTTFLLAAEIFPTSLRATGIASAFACSVPALTIFYTLAIYIGTLWYFYIFTVPCIILALLSSRFLPETLNEDIPDDVEEYQLRIKNPNHATSNDLRKYCGSELLASFI